PNYDYDSAQVFTPELLRVLAPFRSLRFTGWMLTGIGGSSLSDWSNRPRASAFGASPYGIPYEHLVALVNQTGRDAWVSIPVAASDDFVQQFADYLRSNLNFDRINQLRADQGISGPFKLIIEYSNEVWTPQSMAWNRLLATANADPQRFSGSYSGPFGPEWMAGRTNVIKLGKAQADRLVKIANIFRREFGAIGRSDVVAPVLGGWALGAAFSDVGLRFIAEHYGRPNQYISYLAFAPYFDVDDGQTGSLDSLFAGLNTSI